MESEYTRQVFKEKSVESLEILRVSESRVKTF